MSMHFRFFDSLFVIYNREERIERKEIEKAKTFN